MQSSRELLREHRDALLQKALTWVRSARRFQKAVNIVCVMGGAVLAGIGGAMEGGLLPSSGDGAITAKGLCVLLGVALVFVGSVLLLIIQDDATSLLMSASLLEAEAQKHLDDRGHLLARLDSSALLDRRRLALIDANRTMREALEQSLLVSEADVSGAVQAMLSTALRFLIAAIGLDADEDWAISVFQIDGHGDAAILRRIAAARADRLAEQNHPRSWKQNEGFVGAAWVSNRDTIIENGSDPQVAIDYPVPAECRRSYDADRYRSMAAIPVRVGAPEQVWGVIAMSSNREGRFRRDPGNKQVQTVDTVRAIARMTALCATAFARAAH